MEKINGCLSWLCEMMPEAVARLLFKLPKEEKSEEDRFCDLILSRAASQTDVQQLSLQKLLKDRLYKEPIFIDGKSKRVWIDRESKRPCIMISPKSLQIAWAEDKRYWDFTERDGSSFEEVARLKEVCWLEVKGNLENERLLSAKGKYSVIFRVKLINEGGWDWTPVELSVSSSSGEAWKCARFLAGANQVKAGVDGWIELNAGSFLVSENPLDFQVNFSMTQLSPFWKQGLLIDSVKIIPLLHPSAAPVVPALKNSS